MIQSIVRRLRASPRALLLSTFLLFVAGCNILDTDGESDDLRDQFRRWQALNIDTYSFEMQRSCFCGGPHGFVRVNVVNDSVQSLIELETGRPPEFIFPGQYGTINDIFEDLIDRAADANKIDLSFDRTYHFPATVSVDPIKNAVDDEFALTLRNLQR